MLFDQSGRAGQAAASARTRHLEFKVLTVPRAVAFMLLVFFPLFVPSPAAAHVGFDRSDPAEGETAEGPLDEVTLVFTGLVKPVGEKFAVLDPRQGTRAPSSIETPDGMTWILGFDPPLGEGDVAVRWTVQAEDAHAISGGIVLEVAVRPEAVSGAGPDEIDRSDSLGNGSGSGSDAARRDTARGTAAQTSLPESPPGENGNAESGEQLRSTELVGDADADSIEAGLAEFSVTSGTADDFIAAGGSRLVGAGFMGAAGRVLGYTGAVGAIGGFFFSQMVLRRRRDLDNAVFWMRRFGILVVVGSALEVAAQVVIEVGAWSFVGLADLLASSFGLSVGLRFLGGLAWWGLPEPDLARTEPVAGERELSMKRQLSPVVRVVEASPAAGPSKGRGRDVAETFTEYRWQSGASSTLALLGLSLLTASHLFDGHTLSEGNRLVTSFAAAVHVIGGATWGGGVIMLAVTLWNRRRHSVPLEAMELGIRFSILASVAAVVVGAAGLALTWSILDSTSELWTTPWGRLLVVKLAAVGLAAAMGFYNHRTLLPSAVRSRTLVASSPAGGRLQVAICVEALVMVTVIVVTALLVGAAS